jgi:hypothetical protein
MFKHFLNFISYPKIGTIQIAEPFGSDGQTFKISQDSGRYGRDVVIGNEDIKLKLFRDHFDGMYEHQILPDGTEFNHASHGFDYLSLLLEEQGWESEVEYIIEKDGVPFTMGILEFFTLKITQDEIEVSVIQNTNRELIKRREDVFVDAFSDKDLDGNTIPPCQTSNILLKSKPLEQASQWTSDAILGTFVAYGVNNFFFAFPQKELIKFDIDDSYIGLDRTYDTEGQIDDTDRVTITDYGTLLKARERLTNIRIKITNLHVNIFNGPSGTGGNTTKSFQIGSRYIDGQYMFSKDVYKVFVDTTLGLDETFQVDIIIPVLEKGEKIGMAMIIKDNSGTTSVTPTSETDWLMECDSIEITATSTAINSVVKGVRLIDLIRHNVDSISGLPVETNLYDVGNDHYDNFALNGYLIAQLTDKPFVNKFKDLMNIPKEINGDYQINEDKVEVLGYRDFYKNIEIGVFEELPNEENTFEYNKRYFLKQFEYGYKKSSFGRINEEENTRDDIHTDTQWMFPTTKTDGILKIELDHIRSAFLLEEQRRKIVKDNKATENDESIFLVDCYPIEEGLRGDFTAVLQWSGNKVLSDGTFAWNLLGFNIGDEILINNVSVTVTDFTATVITTSPAFFTGSGGASLHVNYPLTDVQYVNRTNEGFESIQGIVSGDNYSNLIYTIKRNMIHWFPVLATAAKYLKDKAIKNTMFRVNDKFESKLFTDLEEIIDKEEIAVNDIASQKILNPIVHNITVFCDFDNAKDLFQRIAIEKGFFRVRTVANKIIKGYPVDAEFEVATNKLVLKLEEKFESDFMAIDKAGDVIFINEVGYDIEIGLKSFTINNNFVCLYDVNSILLANPISFYNIKVNGTLYTNQIDFSNALTAIL